MSAVLTCMRRLMIGAWGELLLHRRFDEQATPLQTPSKIESAEDPGHGSGQFSLRPDRLLGRPSLLGEGHWVWPCDAPQWTHLG